MRPRGGIIRRYLEQSDAKFGCSACAQANQTDDPNSRFPCPAVNERHHFICRSQECRARAAPALAETSRHAAVRCRAARRTPPRRDARVSGFFMAAHASRRRAAEPDVCREDCGARARKWNFRRRSNSGASFGRSPSVMQFRSPALPVLSIPYRRYRITRNRNL
jgi:predicted RNA-binding Zn-ribbon protein involved in translation (DUF1610 family)